MANHSWFCGFSNQACHHSFPPFLPPPPPPDELDGFSDPFPPWDLDLDSSDENSHINYSITHIKSEIPSGVKCLQLLSTVGRLQSSVIITYWCLVTNLFFITVPISTFQTIITITMQGLTMKCPV